MSKPSPLVWARSIKAAHFYDTVVLDKRVSKLIHIQAFPDKSDKWVSKLSKLLQAFPFPSLSPVSVDLIISSVPVLDERHDIVQSQLFRGLLPNFGLERFLRAG
jgi:hypothetical protein